jgi:hypothetical protein
MSVGREAADAREEHTKLFTSLPEIHLMGFLVTFGVATHPHLGAYIARCSFICGVTRIAL